MPQVADRKSASKGFIIFLFLAAGAFAAYYFRSVPEPVPSEAVHRPLMAVLIFDNLNGQPELDFLANSFTRETIAAIGQICSNNLDVIGHGSTVTYRNSRKTLHQIGRELGIDYVLEGGIEKRGDKVGVTAQLTRSSDQTRLWAQTYEEPFADALKIQNQIVLKIASTLGSAVQPTALTELNRGSTNNPAAREAYLAGEDKCDSETHGTPKECLALLQKALRLDPNYPRAHAALAAALLRTKGEAPLAEQHARQALSVADAIPLAHVALGNVMHKFHNDDKAADSEFRKAIALNRSDTNAHREYSLFLLETSRLEEAQEQIRMALVLDPFDVDTIVTAGRIFIAQKSYERAQQQLEKAVTMDRGDPEIRFYLGKVYLGRSMYDDAIREFRRAVSVSPNVPEYAAALAEATAAAGKK